MSTAKAPSDQVCKNSEKSTKANTKEMLLRGAVSVFAEKGYREATCSDISQHAKANIAAINYHFGSKENLFRLSLRKAFEVANEKYPYNANVNDTSPPQKQLLAFITAVIRRNFDDGPAGDLNRIMAHQVSRASSQHTIAFEEISNLQGKHLIRIIRELTGDLSDHEVHQIKTNIIALCIFPRIAPGMRMILFPAPPTESELDVFIQRQYRFALAGLEALKLSPDITSLPCPENAPKSNHL